MAKLIDLAGLQAALGKIFDISSNKYTTIKPSRLPIGTTGGVAAKDHTHGEATLTWGGQNHSNSYSPIDAAMVGILGANRTAFVPVTAVTVEYTRDGGTTWVDYGLTEEQNIEKIGFFTDFKSTTLTIGKCGSGTYATTNSKLRVTLSTANCVYTELNKFIVYVSSNGSYNNWCTIEGRLQANVTSGTDTWVTFVNKARVEGWSGYNVINTQKFTTYGNNPNTQYGQIRFTFGCDTAPSTSYPYYGLQVLGVNCYGGVGWNTPSNLSQYGTIYRYDLSQNAYFPAVIRATSGIFDSGITTPSASINYLVSNNFVKSGGLATQFLKADGSVDSTSYLPTTGGTLTGDITLSNSKKINFKDSNNNLTGYIYTEDDEDVKYYASSNHNFSGNIDCDSNITGTAIIKSGGLATQFLKADGSVGEIGLFHGVFRNHGWLDESGNIGPIANYIVFPAGTVIPNNVNYNLVRLITNKFRADDDQDNLFKYRGWIKPKCESESQIHTRFPYNIVEIGDRITQPNGEIWIPIGLKRTSASIPGNMTFEEYEETRDNENISNDSKKLTLKKRCAIYLTDSNGKQISNYIKFRVIKNTQQNKYTAVYWE